MTRLEGIKKLHDTIKGYKRGIAIGNVMEVAGGLIAGVGVGIAIIGGIREGRSDHGKELCEDLLNDVETNPDMFVWDDEK